MILLDTNALLWLVEDGPELGERARELIDTHAPVHYSAVSVQEMMVKTMKGRLPVPQEVCRALDAEGLRQMPFVGEHAEAMRGFPELAGHDPFDRALLAQSAAEGLLFITSDRVLLSLGKAWIVDARQ